MRRARLIALGAALFAAALRAGPAGLPSDPFLAIGPDGIPASGGSPGLMRYQLSQAIPFPGKLGATARGAAERGRAARGRAPCAAASTCSRPASAPRWASRSSARNCR